LNVFPASLVPIASYISILAVLAWFVSSWIAQWLSAIAVVEQENDASTPSERVSLPEGTLRKRWGSGNSKGKKANAESLKQKESREKGKLGKML
jgi:hypothetical protein